MQKYNTNTAFIDLLFNLLIGFTSLLLLAFLLINPIAETGKIDPVTKMLVTAEWHKDSHVDIDLHMRGPDGTKVNFADMDGKYIILERDDLGISNDTYIINGEKREVRQNNESISVKDLPPGEYIVNLHNYTRTAKPTKEERAYENPIEVRVAITKLDPLEIIFTREVLMTFRKELTIVTFTVDGEGNVSDLRTDIQIPLYYKEDVLGDN